MVGQHEEAVQACDDGDLAVLRVSDGLDGKGLDNGDLAVLRVSDGLDGKGNPSLAQLCLPRCRSTRCPPLQSQRCLSI